MLKRSGKFVRCAAAILFAAASLTDAARAGTDGDGSGPRIRTERLQQAQEAEERAQAERAKGKGVTDSLKPYDMRSHDRRAILAVLGRQQAAWNRGDIDAFMDGYWKSGELRFAGGGDVTRGWQAVLDRYRRQYGSREKMGRLAFSGVDIRLLSADAALAFGRWKIERAGDAPTGLFTALFRNIDGKWVIVHEHTSSE